MQPYRLFPKIVLSIVSVIFLLALIECTLVIGHYDPLRNLVRDKDGRHLILRESNNKEAIFELTPGASGFVWKCDVEINSEGFRDKEYSLNKGKNKRILTIGDSITFGFGVPMEATYPKRLEFLLQTESNRISEVINMGCPGYNIAQIIANFSEKGPRWSPDAVVYGYCLNDLMDADTSPNFRYIEKYLKIKEGLSHRLRLFELVAVQMYKLRLLRLARTELSSSYADMISSDLFDPQIDSETRNEMEKIRLRVKDLKKPPPCLTDYTSPRKIGRLEKRLGQFKELSKSAGFIPVLAIFPSFDSVVQGEYLFQEVHRLVRHKAEERGIIVIDVLDAMDVSHLKSLTIDGVHPTVVGHEMAARHIYEELKKKKVITH